MTAPSDNTSRRQFLKSGGAIAAGSALAAAAIPKVHAAEDNTIRLALIGCGGRGRGAVANAFTTSNMGPIKLYAMADLFADRLQSTEKLIASRYADQFDAPAERQFVGFDAYKSAIDCLRPGDVAMITNFAAWRPVQVEYAVSKGINVFMEKSFATDPPGVRRILKAGEEAEKKNVKIAAGLQCRHSRNRQELIKRIRDGELGDIQLIRAYRLEPTFDLAPKPDDISELHWQIRRFIHFNWVSGGLFAEMDIHQVDEICWLKDQWPVTAFGMGGRNPDHRNRSQILDSYHVEFTFPDGTKGTDDARYISNTYTDFATYVHGTKCAAQFSGPVHRGDVHIFKDQRIEKDNIAWSAPPEESNPWDAEWQALIDSIRNDKPHNEAKYAAMSNLADIMARAAIHSGQMVTWDEAMASDFQWCDYIDTMTDDSPPPVLPNEEGYYPVPNAGQWTEL
ncbi:MAG: Gfo/Idh/MocA family oxidoreductase [Thermoguttaceae bacterium]|nr:Gfo/Idh/MocA family oxidoreductase [Thermoguttaceae bacterium]